MADTYHQSNITSGKNKTVDSIVIPSQGEMKKYSSSSNQYKKDLPASPACKLNWDISIDEKGSSFDNLGYKSDNRISNEQYDTEEQDTDRDCNSEEDFEIAVEDNLPIEEHELSTEPKQVDNENANNVTTGDHSESDEDISNGNANGNPFIAHFEGIIEEVLLSNTEIDEEESITHDANQSYCPEFCNFLKSYLHKMPLWSGVLLGSLDRYLDRDNLKDYPYLSFKSVNAKTEGYIECAMKNLKQDDFPGISRLRPDAFVLENYQRIRRRGNDYERIASKRGQKRKKQRKRIESTRCDIKKNKVNSNKKKENKFETKERCEKFSKPAKNPAVKVKDLSNSDENAETENNYSTVRGKKHQAGKRWKIPELAKEAGRQYDIHESLTSLSSTSLSDNSKIADLFSGLHQYNKTCLDCYKRENIHAEKFFSFFIPLDQDITNLVDSLYDSLTEVVEMFCEVCNKQTDHFRNGYLLEFPTTWVVTFKRFQIDEDQKEKNPATVSLPWHFSLNAGENHRYYNLTSCALHYRQRIDCGHYTALVFNDNSVLEINDTVIKQSKKSKKIFRLWDVCNKDTKICTMTKDGYGLYGKDLKSIFCASFKSFLKSTLKLL
ncbi:Hypothetical predicted protein [Paramuricea clavata]|uniref:Uncharacterized protein n=1 Tax=Paramuricea clavata TaxID=317549 RepID=A0A7D9EB05_PARCT|nr:Hypothetical predicted protein [Paramuricea clavata]